MSTRGVCQLPKLKGKIGIFIMKKGLFDLELIEKFLSVTWEREKTCDRPKSVINVFLFLKKKHCFCLSAKLA